MYGDKNGYSEFSPFLLMKTKSHFSPCTGRGLKLNTISCVRHEENSDKFANKVTSYSSNWITLLLLCTSAPLVLCCDRFDRCSTRVKHEPVDLIKEDYDVSLCQLIKNTCTHTLVMINF